MTDSRVTPQAAVEAAAKAEWAVWAAETAGTSPWDQTSSIERKMWLGGARAALAAASPLLCQPLQDENEQLRAMVEAVRDLHRPIMYDEYHRGTPTRSRACTSRCHECSQNFSTPDGCPTWVALAAVPVGTGNPTQPRADD